MRSQLLPPDTPVSLSEKIRFAIGNMSFPFSVILFSGMVMYYFTDILGIGAAAAGTLLLVARVWDGVNDPLMGMLVDRTRTPIGKARPYIIAGGCLMSVFIVLLFTNPGFSGAKAKLAWAYFTYIGFGMSFTVFMVPMKVFYARLTKKRAEIVSLNSFSMLGTSVAAIIAAMFLMKLVDYFAGPGGDMARGYSGTSIVAGGVLLAGSLILASVKERDFESENERGKTSYPFKEAVSAIVHNKSFIGFCLSSSIVYLGFYVSESAIIYYCIYYLGSADYYTPLAMISYGAPIVSAVTLPFLVRRYGKKTVVAASYVLIALFFALRYMTGDRNLVLMVIFATIAAIGQGYWNTLFTPMALDCALISEAKTGRDMSALFTSSFSLINKMATGISGSVLGFALAYIGYVDNAAEQTAAVQQGLRLLCTVSVAAASIAGLIIYLAMYRIKDDELEEISSSIRG